MDKVQKIREEIERLKRWNDNVRESTRHMTLQEEDFNRGKHSSYLEILNFIDSMQKETVSDDLEEACKQLAENARKHKAETSSPFFSQTDYRQGVMDGAKWQKAKDESTTEDLGEYINELSKQFPEVSFAKLNRIAVRVAKWQKEKEYTCYEEAFEDGAKWKVENLWKPADGDDLPEYDREVVVLIKDSVQRNIHAKEYLIYRIGFGHRPNPDGWDGKNIDTDEVTHYTPKLYDKGGWNAPDIVYWLDARLPYEENKIIKEL